MKELLQKYSLLILLFAGVLILGSIVVITLIFFNRTKENLPSQDRNVNDLNYKFLQDKTISQQDQYLLLLGKILVEQYGTYSYADMRGLQDVLNQSTTTFQSIVTTKLNSVTEQTAMETTIDPDSIVLSRTGNDVALVRMKGNEYNIALGTNRSLNFIIEFRLSGEYWLANNIRVSQ